ncbi:hypothetical protein TKK_0001151 [Trichogramma kaykai]
MRTVGMATDVVGYVCDIYDSHTVGLNKKYQLFKFILNNGYNQKLTILIWETNLINHHSPNIALNQIIHISGCSVRSSAPVRDNYVPFTVLPHTIINFMGIRGYIKDEVPIQNRFGNGTYGLGTITDGNFKIPVIVSQYSHIWNPPLLSNNSATLLLP